MGQGMSLFFSDLGSPSNDRHSHNQYIPDSIACRLYLLTILVETAIDLAIEGDIILQFHESHSSDSEDMATRRMPVYLSIFAFAQCVHTILFMPIRPLIVAAASSSS